MSEVGAAGGAAVIDQQILEPQLANLVDVTCAFGNLASVISDIVAQVNRQTAGMLRLNEGLTAAREELGRQATRSAQRERDLEGQISALRQELRAATSEELFMNFKYDSEKKSRDMEEYNTKLKDDLHSVMEELKTLSGEIAQTTSDMGGLRLDVSRVVSDVPELREEISRGIADLEANLQKHISAENSGPAVSNDEVRSLVKAEIAASAEAAEARTGATLQRLEELVRSNENDLQRSIELKLKLMTPLDAFERFRRDVEKMKVTEVTKQLKAVAKNQARMQADLKVFSSVVESDSKKVERCRESLDLKADKKALEELARFLYVKLKENPSLLSGPAVPASLVSASGAAPAEGPAEPPAQPATLGPLQAIAEAAATTADAAAESDPEAAGLESPPLSGRAQEEEEKPAMPQQASHRETPDATALMMMAAAQAPIEDERGGILEQLSGAFGGSVASELGERIERLTESNNELQGKVSDVRRDLSEMGHFIEALAADLKGVKEHLKAKNDSAQQAAAGVVMGTSASTAERERELAAQQVNVDLSRQIEKLSSQFSEVLRKKADLSAIEQMLVEKENERRQEFENLQQTVERKIGPEELGSLKRAMERDLQRTIAQMQAEGEVTDEVPRFGKSALTRTAIQRCIACDRTVGATADHTCAEHMGVAPPEPQQTVVRDGWFDLAPNIAYKRWIVKDLLKATRDGLVRAPPTAQSQAGTNPAPAGRKGEKMPQKPGSPNRRPGATPSLPPISNASATQQQQ